ncbi:PREDICTED: interferon lambda-3-like [Calidris pugnax]|uniref:interferon lambda-3-like n=2 Tax=Calidris pugnax TaxID=198806 RepID=UPI00071DA659|nr:PREDICTED: interferon lambda-3-like [Calidris pugnax]
MLRRGFVLLFAWLSAANFGAAFPQDALKKGCSLFKYRFLEPQEMKAMMKMKEHFEGIPLPSDHRCNIRLFHRKWESEELSVPDRMMLVKAELDLITDMLELLDDHSFTETHQRPLALLTQAQEDLRVCMATEAPSHQPSKKLRHWLQKLQIAKKTETTSCLTSSAIFHLFQVLDDLRCAAGQEPCA